MSLADLFNPPHIEKATGRLFIDGKPAKASNIVQPAPSAKETKAVQSHGDYMRNKDKIAKKKAAYREQNREKIAAYQRSYYQRHKGKEASRKRAYREKCKAVTANQTNTIGGINGNS